MVRLLGPSSDEGVTPTEELAAILLSKLALEPEAHAHIARASAIPVSTPACSETCLRSAHCSDSAHCKAALHVYTTARVRLMGHRLIAPSYEAGGTQETLFRLQTQGALGAEASASARTQV